MSKTRKILLFIIVSLLLLVALVLSTNFDLIMTRIGSFLIVDEAPQKADVIIVLAGDSTWSRVAYAADLYQDGYADKVLLSGGNTYMTQQALSDGS